MVVAALTPDFIIIGAGSAGSVLADRLSVSGHHQVLLLEAGGSDQRFYVQMPLGYGKTFYDPRLNWMYRAEPDPGLNGQSDYWPRGKLLGGSSSINAMVYIRGHPQDYQDWQAAGNSGWGWEAVHDAFTAMEAGPLQISDVSADRHPLCDAFIAAASGVGLAFNPDFNGETQEGAGLYRLTTRGGRRLSAARAFLRPALRRANLRVETHALATRILFEGARTVGVGSSRPPRMATRRRPWTAPRVSTSRSEALRRNVSTTAEALPSGVIPAITATWLTDPQPSADARDCIESSASPRRTASTTRDSSRASQAPRASAAPA